MVGVVRGQLAKSNCEQSDKCTKNSKEGKGDSKAGNKGRGLGKRK